MSDSIQTIEPPKMNYFQKLWAYRRHLTIEAFALFYVMPLTLNTVALQNFPLEKACRVNFGYNKIICTTILNKGELGIDCNVNDFENTTAGGTPELLSLNVYSTDFNYTVCKAESDVQKLNAAVSGKRAPVAAFFSLIFLLFAGGWADRYNKRKPCMILPTVGQILSYACLLVSALYFDDLPMEFGAYLGTIVPCIFGGGTLFFMALNSHITMATPEPDRVFRFGIFSMFFMLTMFMGLPMSGWLFQKLGYIMSFTFALALQLFGVFYVIFFIKEIKPAETEHKKETADTVTKAESVDKNFENVNSDKFNTFEMTSVHKIDQSNKSPNKLPLWRELFDYTLLKELIQFPFIKRKNNARLLLNLMLVAFFFSLGPVGAEEDYYYRYALRKLGWNGTDYSIFASLTTGTAILGTFIGTAVFSKIFKFTDATVGLLSACTTVLSRFLYAFSKNSTMFYFGGVFELFLSLRFIAIKSIGASIVANSELSKMYSVFGISEQIGFLIFLPLYSFVYQATVDSFPGAIFLFSEIFYIPNVLVFVACYFLLRRRKSRIEREAAERENEQNGCSTPSDTAKPDAEFT